MSANDQNQAFDFCASLGKTVAEARADYDGCCIDFAGDFVTARGGRLAYFRTPLHQKWCYHASPLIDGFIHDLWTDNPMPLAEFILHIGAENVEFPAE